MSMQREGEPRPVPHQPSVVAGLTDVIETVADLVAERVAAAEREPARQFVRLFFANARADLIRNRDPAALTLMALGAFRFLQEGQGGPVAVQVLNTEPAAGAVHVPATIIRTHVTDRPFVVDTIREYLSSRELGVEFFVYPVLRVERDADRRIVAVRPAAEGEPRESLTHCEVPYVADAEQRAGIATAIRTSLEDVVRATDDFAGMVEAARDTIGYLADCATRLADRAGDVGEAQQFLHWLIDGGFVFLGYRSYSMVEHAGRRAVVVDPGSGLGILRDEQGSAFARPVPLDTLPQGLRDRIERGPLLITSKTNAQATVHRRARMDYIGVKTLDDAGRVTGERRFIGLFTSKAYTEDAERIPILREKLRTILTKAGAIRGTHDYKEIITIFNSMPKEELFLASAEEIGAEIRTVLHLYHTHEVKVTLRPDPLGRGVSVLTILPKKEYSGTVRKAIEDTLLDRLGGSVLNHHLVFGGGEQARLYFYLDTTPDRITAVDAGELEQRVRMLLRTWAERVRAELERDLPTDQARRLAQLYAREFSAEYQAATPPAVAREDIRQLESMADAATRVSVRLFATAPPDARSAAEVYSHLRLYLIDERLVLSDFMPILANAGLRVLFVRPFELAGVAAPRSTIYVFAVQDPAGRPIDVERQGELLADALLAVRAGDAVNDELNRLVLNADLPWRAVDLLRACSEYAFQIGAVPSRRSLTSALTTHAESAALLFRLLSVSFDPGLGLEHPERAAAAAKVRDEFLTSLANVTSLADDRALRQLLCLIDAAVRTNFYRHGGVRPSFRSGGVPYISLKFSSVEMQSIARSRLLYEVWVHSSRMAGVHLRTARVARGGIRLSDRPDDFRTEVLGLVRTQAVKNAVIVPGGSKGGFISTRSDADPGARAEEVTEQYRTLMRGLLDLTDNLIDGEVRSPAGVVARDDPDPYLVVAADKGTAHLSDVANGVAAEYDFWLADAFASGGSQGYDHKELAITAKGAWECVRRHFREFGIDTQSEPFTVVGIGDMSGDVFGNGMLLSRQIRLIAAFDHRHIFVDPDPDPAASFRERERLFHAGRTSWNDYDPALLSEGGFIVPRGAKSVALSPQARQALGLPETVVALDGESLIRAVLCAPVDLLWNGGIGTYVKASEESHRDAGDPANDAVRVDARGLRVRVIGEGGNLGLTQAARIAYALAGGRLNTDAIDNAAGVDLSDHEVNLKILLNPVVTAGELGVDERNELIRSLAPEVVELTLREIRAQSLAISMDEQRGKETAEPFHSLMQQLEREGLLDRAEERLPSLEVLHERRVRGEALTRPELALILAYSKLWLKQQLLASALPDDGAAEEYLASYFPQSARRPAGQAALREHRLRREIVATQLVNELVDLMGAAFINRMMNETGAASHEIVRAWLIASQLCGLRELRASLARIEEDVPASDYYRWLRDLERVLERTARWVLANVSIRASMSVVVAEYADGVQQLRSLLHEFLPGEERNNLDAQAREMRQATDRVDLVDRLGTVRYLDQLLEILRVARESDVDALRAAHAHFLVSELLGIPWLRQALSHAVKSRWDQRFAHDLIADLARAQRALTAAVLSRSDATIPVENLVEAMHQRLLAGFSDYRSLLQEIRDGSADPDLAALAVVVGRLRGLHPGEQG
jgi:glutamate dehydrogenase